MVVSSSYPFWMATNRKSWILGDTSLEHLYMCPTLYRCPIACFICMPHHSSCFVCPWSGCAKSYYIHLFVVSCLAFRSPMSTPIETFGELVLLTGFRWKIAASWKIIPKHLGGFRNRTILEAILGKLLQFPGSLMGRIAKAPHQHRAVPQ